MNETSQRLNDLIEFKIAIKKVLECHTTESTRNELRELKFGITKQIDNITASEFCDCGGTPLPESKFCKNCI